MKILIIGSGGREHALAWTLAREPKITLLCAPGNPGIAQLASTVPASIADAESLAALAEREKVDLTVIGPELPLSQGITDVMQRRGLPVFGPTRAAAALESSKSFAKGFMARHRIPTAGFKICASPASAMAALASGEFGFPVVIKADGLAAGKGVVIAEDQASAERAVNEMMVARRFGDSGDTVVLEEFLVGEEASYFVIADGTRCVRLASAQDHKRIFDNDRGPNTGGMGAFAPSPLMSAPVEQRVIEEIVDPVLRGMDAEGYPFRGFLYVGLMLTSSGPRVVEFNVRFGDPEAQVILPMLDEPLSTLLVHASSGTLASRAARFSSEKYVGVVMASGGYPDSSDSGRVISGLDQAARIEGAMLFHAGTSQLGSQIVTSGGRVLTVVGRGTSYERAIEVAYQAVSRISFDAAQFRRDIGRKALGTPLPLGR